MLFLSKRLSLFGTHKRPERRDVNKTFQAHLCILRCSLDGQDTRLSPERPGFESRQRNPLAPEETQNDYHYFCFSFGSPIKYQLITIRGFFFRPIKFCEIEKKLRNFPKKLAQQICAFVGLAYYQRQGILCLDSLQSIVA